MNTTAITCKHNRRPNDFYPTPAWATQELLKRTTISGTVLECCSGNGDIAVEIASISPTFGYTLKPTVWSADIDPQMPVDLVGDASDPAFWEYVQTFIQKIPESDDGIDWVVTNPPYSQASAILPLAYQYARVGVAFLLRLSYLEPCWDRADWLVQHPVSRLIVLPRISFTGGRKTDSVTCGWFVWLKGKTEQRIEVVRRGAS